MSLIDASLMNARALRVRFSKSLASRRQRFSQARVRSTTGCTILPDSRFSFGLARRLWTPAVCGCGNAEDNLDVVVVNFDPPDKCSDNGAGIEPVEIIEAMPYFCGKILKLTHDEGQLAFSLGRFNGNTPLLL